MSSTASSKVSFTIRRPTPVSRASSGNDSDSSSFKVPALPRHLANGNGSTPGSPLARSAPASPSPTSRAHADRDSSDEDEGLDDELVTGFDQFGVQRCVSSLFNLLRPDSQLTVVWSYSLHEKKKEPEGPLVIPALKNKDWREMARKRKALYVPPSAAAQTGADGSVGGLGTRDSINSGPQLSGLQAAKKIKLEEGDSVEVETEEPVVTFDAVANVVPKKEEETEDQKALRAILASASDDPMSLDGPHIDIIPTPSEDDAYRQDVVELPDSASLEDYERIPVSQFGAALLRGMGWKEGTAASKRHKGPIEPYLPQARPALLGIGAKEKEVFDDGSSLVKGKKSRKSKPDRRYVPVVKRERKSGDGGDSGSGERSRERSGSAVSSSKRHSPSPERSHSRRHSRSPSADRRRERDRDRWNDDREGSRDRDRDRQRDVRRDYHDSSYKDHDRDSRRRDGSDDKYDSDRRRERDRRGH
ncbi:uncharacterized protein FIBRA_01595 [Fibroporia radiculosa]|uniref:G-patch domain-containing protein n=1 Tax=Fibroporia radiculosa TaxID=599839 RepID=J4HTL0_9APHY|nr:uncharacterized protein FIBRA_01595 [Fibroporia radiculosa]CCL99577.1 predicted protein [Fibroporia radiculosa]